jgi:hypothetical protein
MTQLTVSFPDGFIVFYRHSLAAVCCEQGNIILSFINLRELLEWHSEHKLDKTDCTPVC